MTDSEIIAALKLVTTATLTTVMLKRGVPSSWIAGAAPFSATDERIVGPAFTMRFVPSREDLATPDSWKGPHSTRAAIEEMPEGCVCVVDTRGIATAGVFGDILAGRMMKRGVAGVVTDGAMRDGEGVKRTEMPIWCAGAVAPASITSLAFVGWQEPIGCGDTAVFPGDIIVADGDGAVVIPKSILTEVTAAAIEQERLEAWIVQQVDEGHPLPGLYPPSEEILVRYKKYNEGET